MSIRPNIFSPSLHEKSKPKKSHTPSASQEAKTAFPPATAQDEEFLAMMASIQWMQEDLNTKLEFIEKQSPQLYPILKSYLSDQSPLTPAQQKEIEAKAKALVAPLKIALPATDPSDSLSSTPPSSARHRKGKTLGSRKKWIPMS